jgi:hypothetical protein
MNELDDAFLFLMCVNQTLESLDYSECRAKEFGIEYEPINIEEYLLREVKYSIPYYVRFFRELTYLDPILDYDILRILAIQWNIPFPF